MALFILIFSIGLNSQSLYSDNIVNDTDLDNIQLMDAYNYADDLEQVNEDIHLYLERYMGLMFKLSQLTNKLGSISDESVIYSHISRLDEISNKIEKQIDHFDNHTIDFKPNASLSELQQYFQKIVYRLSVFSPYMGNLIYSDYKENVYLINYMGQLHKELKSQLNMMASYQQQLGISPQNSGLPFVPNNPQQLSFALESQLNTSILSSFDFQGAELANPLPYSSFATPSNADLFSQGGANGVMNQVQPNAQLPMQQFNYLPSF